MKVKGALCIVVMCLATVAAHATEQYAGTFGAWRVYRTEEGGQTVCYMVSTTTKNATVVKRAQPYIMITHRPVEASTDVFSYGAGMVIDSKHAVTASMGSQYFDLFSVRDTAWARDAQTDHKIARALRAVSSLNLKAFTGKHPKAFTDVFDVTGAVPAYQKIGTLCGLPGENSPPLPSKKGSILKHNHKK